MQSACKIKVLFIFGFGPIVRDTAESRKLYSDTLGIRFTEKTGEYLHREALRGTKSSHSGRYLRLRSHSLANRPGLTMFPVS
jgi:catechol 2,3-dioxygenase-like lactoylglutathione lyase family enzyme